MSHSFPKYVQKCNFYRFKLYLFMGLFTSIYQEIKLKSYVFVFFVFFFTKLQNCVKQFMINISGSMDGLATKLRTVKLKTELNY